MGWADAVGMMGENKKLLHEEETVVGVMIL